MSDFRDMVLAFVAGAAVAWLMEKFGFGELLSIAIGAFAGVYVYRRLQS